MGRIGPDIITAWQDETYFACPGSGCHHGVAGRIVCNSSHKWPHLFGPACSGSRIGDAAGGIGRFGYDFAGRRDVWRLIGLWSRCVAAIDARGKVFNLAGRVCFFSSTAGGERAHCEGDKA